MSRINTNVQSLIAQRVLGQNNMNLNTSLERLSTGLRINRGKDDPAGLIASENLGAEVTATNAAISNAERADQVINIAEGGLQETSTLLNELQGLLTQSANDAGLSLEEKEANQLQIDSILQTIDRISASTSFQGIKLLNGNFDFTTTSVANGVTDFRVNGAKFTGESQNVDVVVTQSAQRGQLFLSLGNANLDFTAGSAFSIEIVGSRGSRELSFSSGTSLADIASTINTFTDTTGVTASAIGTGVAIRSEDYGSREFVSVKATGDATLDGANNGLYGFVSGDSGTVSDNGGTPISTFATLSNLFRDDGQDVDGTINGIAATGTGNTLRVNTDFLDVELTLSTDTSDTLNSLSLTGNTAFTITGGGATFQLGGQVTIGEQVTIGISDVATRKLGRSDLGFLDDLGNGRQFNVVDGESLETAQKIVGQAINDVSSLRGRLGAFQKNVVGATIRNLGVSVENTAAARSVIRDADFAAETASLTRNQILAQASTNTLAQANQTPQNVLQLLG